jgi:glycine cleavage system transcriptional repressor
LIINAVGLDRLGIVSDITGMVIDVGGNVGESQAAKLGSHFSLMMLVQVPEYSRPALEEQLKSMPGMNATVFAADSPADKKIATPAVGCK